MSRMNRAWLLVPIVGTLLVGLTPAVAGLPAKTTKVKVQANKVTTVNAAIGVAAAISGKITSGGKPLPGIAVYAIGAHNAYVGYGSSANDGSYRIIGLQPTTTGYAICARLSEMGEGPTGFGYVSRCYASANWNGTTVPKAAKKVPVSVGHPRTGINIALPKAGGITGTIKPAKVSNVYAEVYSPSGVFVASASVVSGGYKVTGLPASAKGYKVCFSTSLAFGGPSKTGYLGECYNNARWDGGKVPSKAKLVKVKAGKGTGHINASLAAGGAISGTVRAAGTHKPVQYASIEVFDKTGGLITFAHQTQANGKYTVVGLRTYASYVVCASGGQAKGMSGSFAGRCYKNVAWSLSKPSKKATLVSAKAGKTHSGVNLVLPRTGAAKLGAIAGKVTGAGNTPVAYATVTAFTGAGAEVGYAYTGSDGTYTVPNLTASRAGYVVCFAANSAGGTGAPATGYRRVCYKQQAWDGGKPPAHATKVRVKAGKTSKGINAALSAGGAISGTITNAVSHSALQGVTVTVSASAQQVGAGYTDSSGKYTVTGLTPSTTGYVVCFYATYATPAPATGFRNQCYKNRPWDGSGTSS
jgi:hypothetical protein